MNRWKETFRKSRSSEGFLLFDGKLVGLIVIVMGFLVIASVWSELWSGGGTADSIGYGGVTVISDWLSGTDVIIELAAGVQNGTIASFGLYQEMVVFSNIPFTALFVSLLVFSIISFSIQYKNMRRNHKILYGLLFALCAGMIFNMLSRMGSELTLLITNKEIAKTANQIVKGIDRIAVIFVIYIEILILSHICSIFLDTTRVIEKLSMQNYKRYRRFLVFLLVGIAGIFIILSMIVFVFAGLMSSPFGANSSILRYLLLALFLCGGLIFLGSTIFITAMLTIIGRLLLSSMNNELKSTNNASFSVKQSALRKALTLQVGLSIALTVQCLGFICIPFSVLWEFSMYVFHMVYNLAIFIFIIFIVSIFNPLKDVQRFFKPKNKKFGESIGRVIAVSDSNVDDYYYEYEEDEDEDGLNEMQTNEQEEN